MSDVPVEQESGGSSRYFQIHEDDLTALEKACPEIMDRIYPQLDAQLRVKFRNVQKILSNVRWNYGPPTNVTVIPA